MSRDRAIDVLRGWAIVLMITSHVGSQSHVGAVFNLPLLIDAAGPFVLLSGFVLGMGAQAGKPVLGVLRRAGQLYVIHVVLMAIAIAVHEATHRMRVPSVEAAGGITAVLWKVPALRLQALDFLNILPMFVVFFLAAPLLVGALRRGLSLPLFGVSAAVWAYTQRAPDFYHWVDPAVGEDAFVLPAWQFAFVVGVLSGYHLPSLGARFWSGRGRVLAPAVIAVFVALFVFAQLQRNFARKFGTHLSEHASWMVAKATWAPLRALYTVSALGAGYWLCKRALGSGSRVVVAVLERFEMLGRKSLCCFLVHLPVALAASAFLVDGRPRLVQDAVALGAFAFVFEMARRNVAGGIIPN